MKVKRLILAALLTICLHAESAREKQLALDKAGLVQDKILLQQSVSKLTQQVSALLTVNEGFKRQAAQVAPLQAQVDLLKTQVRQQQADIKQLHADLDSRPATVILSGDAKQSIDNADKHLKDTEARVKAGNEKTAKALSRNSIIEIGSLAMLGLGFAFLTRIFVRRRTRDADEIISKLTVERDKAQASLVAIQEQLAALLKEKGLSHGGE